MTDIFREIMISSHHRHHKQLLKAFSIVELLVVIAVMGIIGAIAIGYYSGITDTADTVKARRNAQTIATIATSAQAAGDQIIETAADLDEAVAIIVAGSAQGMGSFSDMKFQVADLSTEDVEEAKEFLTFQSGSIQYDSKLD